MFNLKLIFNFYVIFYFINIIIYIHRAGLSILWAPGKKKRMGPIIIE